MLKYRLFFGDSPGDATQVREIAQFNLEGDALLYLRDKWVANKIEGTDKPKTHARGWAFRVVTSGRNPKPVHDPFWPQIPMEWIREAVTR